MGVRKAVAAEQLSADIHHLSDVINEGSDLACVVVGAAFLDGALKSLLAKKLLRSTVADKLLDESSALGNFAARADLAYCLGLVKKEHYQDLNRVSQIRNQFAHKHLQLDFADPKVCELCGKLNEWKLLLHGKEPDTPLEPTPAQLTTIARNQFTLSVMFLCNWLLLAALGLRAQDENPAPATTQRIATSADDAAHLR
jgi:DNA-binding MltR family transcriptional regulator